MTVLTLGDVKPLLNFQGTVDDAVLESVITQAEAWVVERCGPISDVTLTKRVTARGDTLILPVIPAISVTSVTNVETGVAVTLDADDVNLTAGVIDADYICDDELYEVVYHAGRTTVPEPLKRAVIEVTRYLWRPMQGPQVNNQAVDASMSALRMAEMLMAPYLLPGFA